VIGVILGIGCGIALFFKGFWDLGWSWNGILNGK